MHVLSGVIYLTFIWVRMKKGHYADGDYNHIEMVGLFWHFVDLVWILVFTFVYLVPDNPVV
jgi:heme/copper-type cytochrome/quinol oxidase subunit 3